MLLFIRIPEGSKLTSIVENVNNLIHIFNIFIQFQNLIKKDFTLYTQIGE